MYFPNTFHHDFYPFQNQAEIDRVRKITWSSVSSIPTAMISRSS